MSDWSHVKGLSFTGSKDLEVSPLRYWARHVDPNREPIKPSPAMVFGSALHCRVLESEQFNQRFCRRVTVDDFPGCLVTEKDLRGWLVDKGHKPKGASKAALIDQIRVVDPAAPIYDLLRIEAGRDNDKKEQLSAEDWDRLHSCAASLLEEPLIQEILAEGEAEVFLTTKDEETGVTLKGVLDWVSPRWILDVKTFAQVRGKTIEKSIADAIYYEKYYRQAYIYRRLAKEARGWKGRVVYAFVEGEPPHDVRLKELKASSGYGVNLYWEKARIDTRNLLAKYAEYSEKFGEAPWRYAQQIEELFDADMPGMAWER